MHGFKNLIVWRRYKQQDASSSKLSLRSIHLWQLIPYYQQVLDCFRVSIINQRTISPAA